MPIQPERRSRYLNFRLFEDHPQINGILNEISRKIPMLITISGKPGIGKSAFVHEALTLAREQHGWRTIGEIDQELQMDSSATKQSFSAQLLALLRRDSPDPPSSHSDTSGDETEALIHNLKIASPVLIGIDRFWPSTQLLNWFTAEFIPKMKATGAPIAVLCAGLHTDRLSEAAECQVDLDHLDEGWARQRLAAAGATITPPLEPAELTEYARQLSAKPELLASFLRVFFLADAQA